MVWVSDSPSHSVAGASLSVAVSPSVAVGVVSVSLAKSGEFLPEFATGESEFSEVLVRGEEDEG
jgi:hypothetical protein